MFALLLLSTMALSIFNLKAAYAQGLSSPIDVKVDHQIIVHDGGLVTLNDTVTLSETGELQSFRIGFPYKYKSNVYYVFAYASPNSEQRLTLDLDVGLGSLGFYGVEVDLTKLESHSFSVVFEFSDLITGLPTGEGFYLDFPVYPSLAQEASVSNTTVFLPPNANYAGSSHPFNQTTSNTLNIVKEPLAAFTSETGIIGFEPSDSFSLLEVNEVKRDIVLDEWNELFVSDFYNTTNRATNTSTLWVPLPQNAFDVDAKDELGNELTVAQQNVTGAIKATITLKTSIQQNQTAYVLVAFRLPWKDHIAENGWSDFSLNFFEFFKPMNLTVRKLTVTIDLPEGAKFAEFQSSNEAIQPNIVQTGIYKETPIFTFSNVSSYQDLDFTVKYSQVIFWASFRPTLWTGALVAIIAAIGLLWQIRKAPVSVPTALPIHPEELRNYVRTYEEERKILQERESLEAQARKGKIPRRLYRVRSRTLESRLSVLSRDLATLREKIRTVGPRYAGMMRQIEVAETELQGVEADIRRTEIRYRRGEISAAAYHKLLEDSYRRRDRAKTNIDGVLLRLREEIS